MIKTRGRIDKVLVLSALALCAIGLLFIYSATWDWNSSGKLSAMVLKQAVWVAAGLVLMGVIASINYLKIMDLAYFLYVLNLGALVFLLLFGGERFGARRWIDLGPVSLQPSEFMKMTIILVLAAYLGERREKIGSLSNYLGALALILPAALLIFLQPDLGTALVLVPILFSVLFICREKVKYILTTLSLGLASMPVLWHFLKDYQKNRLLVFLNPDLDPLGAGYTIIQSKIAVGSGGLTGKGWLNGTQSYLKFLPERHTDFIFSVIGEEWGFLGAVLLLCVYMVIIVRGIRIIAGTDNIYGRAIAAGVVTLISFHVFVNISMTIGLMPVVGLPLPAISYGGSGTVMTLAGIGFLLSVGRSSNL